MLVYGKCECFVMQMLYVCILCASCGSSQCCVLHDLFICVTVIVRAGGGGGIWLNSFSTVLFSVCSAVTVECCILYQCAWVCLVCLQQFLRTPADGIPPTFNQQVPRLHGSRPQIRDL